MKISIKQPVALHEKGGKEVNEDFIFPLQGQANIEEKLFIISDGEGGANVGDVASKLVALSFAKFFASTPPKGDITQEYLQKALSTAEQALSAYKEAHPESAEMATSLAMLHLGSNQVSIAWVGSSYVFHYDRSNKKLTSFSGNKENLIKGSESPVNVELATIPISDIHPSDYFFLASDGILEQVDNHTLETIFENDENPEPKLLLNEINNLSQSFTQDNYSCYLVQVEKVGEPVHAGAPIGATTGNGAATETQEQSTEPDDEDYGDKNAALMRNLAFGAIVLLILCLIAVAWWTTTRPKIYDDLMARGDANLDAKKYELAISQFDSAIVATKDEGQITVATTRKAKAIALRDQALDEDDPLESLTESAEIYNENGNEFFKLGNYEQAVRSYRNAERVKERDGEKLPDIPQDKMVAAYLHLADNLYEGENQNCNRAVSIYEKAFKILESPEVAAIDEEQVKRARERFTECTDLIAQGKANTEPVEDKPAITQAKPETEKTPPPATTNDNSTTNEDNQPSTTRRVAEDNNTKTKTRSIDSNQTATQPEATRRTGINSTTVSPEKAAELEKFLATGKRLFVKARNSESGFEYRKSADNLESSMPNLDGPGAYMLAFMYHSGLGVDKDETKALKYAQISALRGWAAGQYLYGHILLLRKYPRDTVTAKQSLNKAADQNYLDAINRLQELN